MDFALNVYIVEEISNAVNMYLHLFLSLKGGSKIKLKLD